MPTQPRPASVVFGDQPILTTYRRPRRTSRLLLWVALAAGAFIVAYAVAIRPWQLHWGATTEEARRPLSGDRLVPEPLSEATRAITVDAPPHAVWTWLVQMGQGRGGMYSYDWLENLVGCDIHTADDIVPKLQHLKIGDSVRLASKERFPDAEMVVAEIQPERALVLRSPPSAAPDPDSDSGYVFTWAFVLDRLDGAGTRLIMRTHYEIKPHLVGVPALLVAVEPIEFGLTQEMLRGIKARAESAERAGAAQPGTAQ